MGHGLKAFAMVMALTLSPNTLVRAGPIEAVIDTSDGPFFKIYGVSGGTASSLSSGYGQTFTVPNEVYALDRFRFAFDDISTIHFYAYVTEWSDASYAPIGPILYQSHLRESSNPDGDTGYGEANAYSPLAELDNGWEIFTFNTKKLALAPDKIFAAFVVLDGESAYGNAYDLQSYSTITSVGGTDIYSGGHGIYSNQIKDMNIYSNWCWYCPYGRQGDSWFQAYFFAPEPGTFALLSLGLLGLGFTARLPTET